ncbi:HigA family addiction module antitoxin [Pseudooceanicola marinus]|uniref:HigA family addiction module antitoxin n=1 Tax=Pseudooceanicola marinus TaxID=396013 RepID=UPI001CD3952E|nr:HigA family addiction module antitoxin [Pseudooceanicola marinus]MCA1338097.1 HigA family addiction module antidote protein [Pseudooceanicola marinus]
MTMMKVAVHPGEILRELYLDPLEMSPIALAKRLGVPRTRIERLCKLDVSMSVDTALRLAKFFSTTPDYWLNMQKNFDLISNRDQVDVSGIRPLQAA